MLSEIIGTLSFFQPTYDDDFIDRLNYYYTTTFVIVCAITISFKMLGGRPLECWVPAEYQSSWEDYSEVYCWAQNTYYIPFDRHIPKEIPIRETVEVSYYQWCPFFLVFSAFAFYFPCIMWRVMNDKSGIRLNDIVNVVKDPSNLHPESREKNIEGLSAHLLSMFRRKVLQRGRPRRKKSNLHNVTKLFNVRKWESYMTTMYLIIKLMFTINAFSQLFLMNKFLQTDDYGIYGFGVIRDLLSGKGWKNSGNFPRVTMCDMEIRVLGNIQRHTVQCVLVINIFIEKIFIMLWMWYTLLAVATMCSFVFWFFTSVIRERRLAFITKNLEIADVDFDINFYQEEVDKFVEEWIKTDGVFVLRMITIHNGIMFAMELTYSMWATFLEEQHESAKIFDHVSRSRKVSTYLGSPGSAVIRGLDEVDETLLDAKKQLLQPEIVFKPAKDKNSDTEAGLDDDDNESESGSILAPLRPSSIGSTRPFRPSFERRQSVYIPLVLPHTDIRNVPNVRHPSTKKFARSYSTNH